MTTPCPHCPPATLYCSFCGKSQHDVLKLIAGPTALICGECVRLCQAIIEESSAEKAEPAPAFSGAQEARAAEIAREIVADMLKGSDARIREVIDAAFRERSPSFSVTATRKFPA